MPRTAAIAFCDSCETATARMERGWRGYIATDDDGDRFVTIVCPACAEQRFGEDEAPHDEAAWSD